MKKILFHLSFILTFLFIQSCKNSQQISANYDKVIDLDTITIQPAEPSVYHATKTKINDLVHTKLDVSFDWDSTYLYGKATLTLHPHFYSTQHLTLDAKGFQLHEVALMDSLGVKHPLKYSYDSSQIQIDLGKTFHQTDTYHVFIDYTAMPNKLKDGGSAAITDEKGLYFINPDGSEKNKPRQIWTQGETESSSCWFPTIDATNQRSTQEIFITVADTFKTLSNGILMFQTENSNGSRTDYWKQELPHAPYLFMMAVGDFAIVKDQWRDIAVNYYVEPEYKAIAKDIYPHTVEMLEFFSTLLNYDYPWEKFDQIVVRDYVSGAMENTGAVVFGDFIQGNKRYLIDNSGEDVVAHELFHHWFGDLVTCESWSNLPLNESFATYGEYLWTEHKHGKDAADYQGLNDLRAYLNQAKYSEKRLVRYDYKNMMEMFDVNSYQKGGRVLHMLRSTVGDKAFFASLNLYLKENEFQSVEIDHLRLAFEKITGQDLKWFFDQWFFKSGNPKLKVEKNYIDSTQTLSVTIEQQQSGEDIPAVYHLPTTIEIVKANGEKVVKDIIITEKEQHFDFKLETAPLLVNLDADGNLLAEIVQDFSTAEAAVLYRKGGNFLDRYNAIKSIKRNSDSLSIVVLMEALNDSFWAIRELAISSSSSLSKVEAEKTFKKLNELAKQDKKSDVRAAAIEALVKNYEDKIELSTLQDGLQDSSYLVVATALHYLYEKDSIVGIKEAEALEKEESSDIKDIIASIYAKDGGAQYLSFFTNNIENESGLSLYTLSAQFGDYLEKQSPEIVESAIPTLLSIAHKQSTWWMRMGAISSLAQLNNTYKTDLKDKKKALIDASENNKVAHSKEIQTQQKVQEKIQAALEELRETEKNTNLLRIINAALK